jgi:hypothetical protein
LPDIFHAASIASNAVQPYSNHVLNGKGGKRSPKKRKEDIGQSSAAPKNLPDWVFVVQFRDPREPGSVQFSGRAEHVMSGESTGFQKPEELIDFFGRVMKQLKP